MARLIGQRMAVSLGQPIVVENRAGAGGTIAARVVADSEPDGYTLLLGNTSTLIISPLMYKNVGYDALKAFAPIARLGTTSDILVVNPNFPAKTLAELIAYAKANPGKLNYSTPGIGTPPHLIGEMLKLSAPGSRSCMCPTRAAASRSRRWSPVRCNSPSRIPRSRCRWCRPAWCGRWR